jgi:hypothetical protein
MYAKICELFIVRYAIPWPKSSLAQIPVHIVLVNLVLQSDECD